MKMRRATEDDLPFIVSIYNWAVVNTTATFDTKIKSVDERTLWFHSHTQRYPIIVVTINEKVVAWGSLTKWSERGAYADTAEISFYVDPDYHGQGIGTKVLHKLVEIAKDNNLHTLISRIAHGPSASMYIHEKLSFDKIGTMREVGRKFGRLIDVTLMQRMLS